MDPLFTKQIHSLTPSTRLPLLHGLKKVLSYTNYSFGAIYEAIDGPHCFGCQPFKSDQDTLPLLTLLGGERAIGRHANKHQHRQKSSFKPEELFMLSKIPSETFSVNDMIPISLAIGQDGPYFPAEASYLVSIDILADVDAHRSLDSIGWSDFHRIPGWLSETLAEARAVGSSKAVERYLCMQAFEYHTNLHDVARILDDFMQGSYKPGRGYTNFKVTTYKLFGSAGAGI